MLADHWEANGGPPRLTLRQVSLKRSGEAVRSPDNKVERAMTSENNPYEHRHIDTDNESEKFLQLFIRIMSDCKLASDNAVDLYAANMLCS